MGNSSSSTASSNRSGSNSCFNVKKPETPKRRSSHHKMPSRKKKKKKRMSVRLDRHVVSQNRHPRRVVSNPVTPQGVNHMKLRDDASKSRSSIQYRTPTSSLVASRTQTAYTPTVSGASIYATQQQEISGGVVSDATAGHQQPVLTRKHHLSPILSEEHAENYLLNEDHLPPSSSAVASSQVTPIYPASSGEATTFTASSDSSSTDLYLSVSAQKERELYGDFVIIPPLLRDIVAPKYARTRIVEGLFDFGKMLGSGMSCQVFKVRCKASGNIYALKQLSRERKSDEWSQMLYATEVKFLRKMAHKGIVSLIETFMDENYLYILTEYGYTDLFKRIKASKHLSEAETRDIVRSVLKTMVHLHSKKVVHRDCKPENLIFTVPNSNEAKFIDMGDSIMIEYASTYKEFVGTRCYLAPERWKCHKGWQLMASDIWAIGVLTFETVTGKRLFWGSNDSEMRAKIRQGKWRYPSKLRPSSLACHFIETCLNINPAQRPSAAVMLKHPWFSHPIGINDNLKNESNWRAPVPISPVRCGIPLWAGYYAPMMTPEERIKDSLASYPAWMQR